MQARFARKWKGFLISQRLVRSWCVSKRDECRKASYRQLNFKRACENRIGSVPFGDFAPHLSCTSRLHSRRCHCCERARATCKMLKPERTCDSLPTSAPQRPSKRRLIEIPVMRVLQERERCRSAQSEHALWSCMLSNIFPFGFA